MLLNSYQTPQCVFKQVYSMCMTDLRIHSHESRKCFLFETKDELYSCLTCHMCGDCSCCEMYFAISNGQDLTMLGGCPLGVLRCELLSQKTRLDLRRLYQSRPLGRHWPISISGSSLVPSASEAFNSYLSEIH